MFIVVEMDCSLCVHVDRDASIIDVTSGFHTAVGRIDIQDTVLCSLNRGAFQFCQRLDRHH